MSVLKRLLANCVADAAADAAERYFRSDEFAARIDKIIIESPLFCFLRAMQRRYMERAPSLQPRQAWEHSRTTLRDFLAGDKIEFGDPRYDWSADAASILVDEDLTYWEAA